MDEQPWFKFHSGDWIANTALRMCTSAQRGAWIDTLALMHRAPEVGVLRVNLAEIASAVRGKASDLQALVAHNILKGTDTRLLIPFTYAPRLRNGGFGPTVVLIAAQDGPLWFSSRMVTDEYLRIVRGHLPDPYLVRLRAPPDPAMVPAMGGIAGGIAVGIAGTLPATLAGGIAGDIAAPAFPRAPATRAPLQRGEGESESETEIPLPEGRVGAQPAHASAPAREGDLTVQQAEAILTGAGLQLQPHDHRVVELLRLGATGYELEAAGRKAANVRGNWMPYMRRTIEGMRADAAQPLAGTPVQGNGNGHAKTRREEAQEWHDAIRAMQREQEAEIERQRAAGGAA